MAINIQPQRVPIGTFIGPNGRPVEVTITTQWYKVLEQLASIAGASGGSTNDTDDEGIGPGGTVAGLLAEALGGGSGDEGPGPAAGAALGVLLADALERLSALEAAPDVSALRSQVATLEEAIADHEQRLEDLEP